MDRFYDLDQYGNRLGVELSNNQTDTLNSAIGLGADGLSKDESWVKSAYDENGNLMSGDWSGTTSDTNNAMDDLLSSEKFNNGRVPDVKMISNVNKLPDGDLVILNDNQQTGIKGILEENVINDIFLSEMNTKVIQDTIRYAVYQNTNMVIDYQSPRELYIIMRSIMLQHANFRVGQSGLLDEIKKLNKFVVDYAVKEVSSNVEQYDVYIKDIQNLPTPMDRPGFSSDTSRNRSQDISAHIGIQ
jgi:hypothetical protein